MVRAYVRAEAGAGPVRVSSLLLPRRPAGRRVRYSVPVGVAGRVTTDVTCVTLLGSLCLCALAARVFDFVCYGFTIHVVGGRARALLRHYCRGDLCNVFLSRLVSKSIHNAYTGLLGYLYLPKPLRNEL